MGHSICVNRDNQNAITSPCICPVSRARYLYPYSSAVLFSSKNDWMGSPSPVYPTKSLKWRMKPSSRQYKRTPNLKRRSGTYSCSGAFFYYATALIARFSAPKWILPESEEESHGILQFPVKSMSNSTGQAIKLYDLLGKAYRKQVRPFDLDLFIP